MNPRVFFGTVGSLAVLFVVVLVWMPPRPDVAVPPLPSVSVSTSAGPVGLAHPVTPLFFVENQGQAPADVRFHAEAVGHTVLFLPDALVFRRTMPETTPSQVVVRFENAAPEAALDGINPQRTRVHFYRGDDPNDWHTDPPVFEGVRYHDLYPGIDLIYRGKAGRLKSDFVVAPGADPAQIRLRYQETDTPYIRDDGALVLGMANGTLVETAPIAFQEKAGRQVPVEAHYAVHADGTVGFALDAYDATLPLIIDPELLFETTVGGSNQDIANAITYAPDGTLIIAGQTLSNDFPLINAYDNTLGANGADMFIMKINPDTGEVLFATFLGGDTPVLGFSSATDEATGLAVDDDGILYLLGETTASDFPTINPIQADHAGAFDLIVARLTPDGTLDFATYLGGIGFDQSSKLALSGETIWITGTVEFAQGGFPTVNPLQNPGGFNDALVARLEATGDAYVLTFSTPLGGENNDRGEGIAVDGDGNVIVGGSTGSPDFPTVNAVQPTLGGNTDGFLTKLASDASALLFSTFLGGNGFDNVADVAVDAAGNIAVGGSTTSPDFPTLNPPQASLLGDQDAFVSLLDPGGALAFSTFWGGSDFEAGTSIGARDGMVLLGGNTFSPDIVLVDPLEDGPPPPSGFLTAFDATGAVQASTTVNGFVASITSLFPAPEWGYVAEKLEDVILGVVHIPPATNLQTTLAVSKTASETGRTTGDVVEYTIIVTNTGTVDALDVRFKDDLDDNRLAHVQDTGDCETPFRFILECKIGTLAPGASDTVYAKFRVRGNSTDGGGIRNDVTATSTNALPAMSMVEFAPLPDLGMVFYTFAANFYIVSGKQVETIDIYIDNVRVADDLARQSSTGEVPLALGRLEPRFEVVDGTAPNNSAPLETFMPNFLVGDLADEDAYVPDATALLFVEVAPDSIDLLVKHDVRTEAADPTQVEFFLAHAAFSGTAYDLRLADGTVLFDDVAPRDLTDYATLAPGVHDLQVTTTDGSVTDLFRVDLSAHQGEALMMVLVSVVEEGGKQESVALLAFDAAGNTLDVPVVTASEPLVPSVDRLVLEDNYPNPFHETTTLRFTIPAPATVRVEVFDLLGRVVLTQTVGPVVTGRHAVPLDAAALSSGVYVYRVVAEGAAETYTQTSQFVLLN